MTATLLVLILVALMTAWVRARPVLRALTRAPGNVGRFDRPWLRFKGTVADIGLHRRLMQRRYSGVLHAMIFCGFVVLFTAIVQSIGHGLIPSFSLAVIGGDSWIALLQDIFALVVLAGIALAAWQRYVVKPARYQGSNSRDATIIYVLVVAIVLSMLLEFASAIVAGAHYWGMWRPVAGAIAAGMVALGMSSAVSLIAENVFYWIHILAILTFLAYIPASKHRHIFSAGPNIFLRKLDGKGVLPPPVERQEEDGILSIEDFSWKHQLDLMSCTECGRCQQVCPAYASGLPLSPKSLIMDLRDYTLIDGSSGPLVGGVISEQTLWACTTCRACMEVCPLHIEHVPKIVEMRRQLVEDASVPPTLQDAFTNLQNHGNSMGRPARQRPKWVKDAGLKIKDARREPVDILWFVGDYASYDARVQRITAKFGRLMQAAGVDFGILWDEERNSGNDVRRAGEEGLFEMLASHNMEALRNAVFNRIVTTDPHSLNALKQEYSALGARYDVLHHTDLLLELVDSGRLSLKTAEPAIVTYHDPCYLGRYNGGFEAPRRLIELAGYDLQEMPRNRTNSFCCGAGGGRIWCDDSGVKERPSENRIKEALSLDFASFFVVSCPKDFVMYTAAVQALNAEDKLKVVDVLDLVEIRE